MGNCRGCGEKDVAEIAAAGAAKARRFKELVGSPTKKGNDMSIVQELTDRQKELVNQYMTEIQRLNQQAEFLRNSLMNMVEFNMPEEADTFDISKMAFIKKDPETLDLEAD